LDERVEDVLQNLELEICGGLLRVELVGFACDRRDQMADDPSPRSTRSPAEQAVSATMSDATMPTAANTAGLVIAITPEPFAFGSLPAGDLKPLGAITRDFAERTLRYSAA